MSVFGGVMLFTSGVIIGGCAVWYNRRSIECKTSRLIKENENLRTSAWKDKMEYETHKAWSKGYHEGRKSPMSDVERLADTLEGRRIDFRTVREGSAHGQAAKR